MDMQQKLPDFHEVHPEKQFNKRLLSIVPHLHPYVKHRLYIAESIGILPRNMYCSNGIIDDAILDLYQDHLDIDMNTIDIELKLFKITDEHIDNLYQKEGWHQQAISTNHFLMQELEKLEENYTVVGDHHFIMNEELTDNCYHQEDRKKKYFIYDDLDSEILKIIDSEPSSERNKQKLLGRFYSWLPLETSKIIDLFVFGKLNFSEIATIKEMTPQEVKSIIIDVRKSFRKNLV